MEEAVFLFSTGRRSLLTCITSVIGVKRILSSNFFRICSSLAYIKLAISFH